MIQFLQDRFKKLYLNDFFLALVFLILYLCTNSYIYGWDDQHLEIPLLKHLIDPSLYKGDYYVESLAKHFSSYLFPILAKIITVKQIPATYLILFLIARYFMFFWVFKLWNFISKDRFAAVCATLMFFLMGRTEEFLYRTFSHQELAEGFMFAGIYFFFRERYILAAFIFGLAANIHAIYNLFPMCFMMGYIILFDPKRWSVGFKAGLVFILSSLPFLLWQIPASLHDKLLSTPIPPSQWIPLYIKSNGQNFIFWGKSLSEALKDPTFLIQQLEPYAFLLLVYILLLNVFPTFKKDKKMHVCIGVSVAFIITSFIFTYLIPSRFAIDLNLIRNEQYMRFFLMGYITLWAVKSVKEYSSIWKVFIVAMLFVYIGFGNIFYFEIKTKKYLISLIIMGVIALLIGLKKWPRLEPALRKSLILIPLIAAFISFCQFHYNYIQAKNHDMGFWQFQRNWKDMQLYVRDHTPKDALILAPIDTDMGGFRIHSERKVLVCIRDCGIVGFDYGATVEWEKRMQDLKDFMWMTNKPVDQAVVTAILKYKVDYIVFMNYYEPQENNPAFKKIYQNEVLALYKVLVRV